MNKKSIPYIYIIFLSFIYSSTYGQEIKYYGLKITSLNKNDTLYIASIPFKRRFDSEKDLKRTKDSVITLLKEKGFYALTQDSVTIKNKQFTYNLRLGQKVTTAVLKVNLKDKEFLKSLNFSIKETNLTLKIEDLKKTLSKINNTLVSNGETFSKVKLSEILVFKSILTAKLIINRTKKRTVDKIIVKGYTDFPTSFLKNYFNVPSTKALNLNLIEGISSRTNQLNFIKEIKKPEILFSNDSTVLYLYLKKVKANYFDGLINFNSENEKIKLRGYFNLNLNNTFNKGEQTSINWRNNGNNKQELNLKSTIPYVFKTKLTPTLLFNLYRHDSTYINNNIIISLSYPISKNLNVSLTYDTESSRINNSNGDYENYDKDGLGIGLEYRSNGKNRFLLGLDFFIQKRKTVVTNVYKQLNLNIASEFKISKRIDFHIKNSSKLTDRKTSLLNELFRSGGAKSLRGFQENSILSNSYSYINSEFKLNLKNNTFLYSIQDTGIFNINNTNTILSALGLGYQFNRANNKFNIEYIIGNPTATNALQASIINVKIVTLF